MPKGAGWQIATVNGGGVDVDAIVLSPEAYHVARMVRQGTWYCPTLAAYYGDWAPAEPSLRDRDGATIQSVGRPPTARARGWRKEDDCGRPRAQWLTP